MDLKWKCRDCGLSFSSKKQLRLHKSKEHPPAKSNKAIPCTCSYCGLSFPSKNKLINHICEVKPKHPRKPNDKTKTWICNDCGLVFETRAKMYIHRREIHPSYFINLKRRPRNQNKICSRCNQPYTGLIKKHYPICPGINHSRIPTEEVRKKISIGRSKWLKEHPDQYPWRRKDKFKSIPCEHLKSVLRKDRYEFCEEFHDSRWDRNFSMDIAFLDKKLAVEVNGTQHYTRNGVLAPYYQERHDYIEKRGWIVLEVFYTNVYKQNEVDKIKKAIDERTPISDEEHKTLIQILVKRKEENELKKKQGKKHCYPSQRKSKVNSPIAILRKFFQIAKSNLKILENENNLDLQRKIENAIAEGTMDIFGRTLQGKYPIKIWEERKEKILSQKIDFTKFGWVNKIMQTTGMTRRIIENTIKHFPNEFSHFKYTNRKKV